MMLKIMGGGFQIRQGSCQSASLMRVTFVIRRLIAPAIVCFALTKSSELDSQDLPDILACFDLIETKLWYLMQAPAETILTNTKLCFAISLQDNK